MTYGRDQNAYGNPGYDQSGRHVWDTPPYPGADMPMPAPGVDPRAFQREAEYVQARDATHFHIQQQQREQAMQAAARYPAVSSSLSTAGTPAARTSRANSVVAPSVPSPAPKPKYAPAKYLVKDTRVPSIGDYYTILVSKVIGLAILTGSIYCFLTLTASRVAIVIQLVVALSTSAVCWGAVIYRAEKHNVDARRKPGAGPLWWGALVVVTINLLVTGVDLTWSRTTTLALIALMLTLLVATVADGAEDISSDIIKKNWVKRLFATQAAGQKCQVCGVPAGEAVAMRRYFYTSPNTWQNYLPVCAKHQHYVCEFDEDGKQSWPQSGDCTQTGLILAKPKRMR